MVSLVMWQSEHDQDISIVVELVVMAVTLKGGFPGTSSAKQKM